MTARTHDHEIKIDNDIKKLNIARDSNGKALYEVSEGVPSYQSPLLFSQSDWKGGHGQHTYIEPDCYYEGQSIETTQPGRVFLGPLINEVKENDDTALDTAPVCFAWFAATTELLCATSGKIYRYNVGDNLKWTAATTTVASVKDLVEYNTVMYAARGSDTNKYYTSVNGIVWTITDLTDAYAQTFFNSPNAAGTANVLWKSKHNNEIASTTNGVAGGTQWTSPAYIGDTSNKITNIFLSGDRLLIGRTDNLYWYDSDGGVHPQMDDLKHYRTTKNFQYVAPWQSMIYFSLGTGIGEIDLNDRFDMIGPLQDIDDIGKAGTCVGLTSTKDFIYAAIDEGTNTIIYKGREVTRRNGLRWEWCPFVYLGANASATLKACQHSATERRLWSGYGASGTTTAYTSLFDDATADSNARFAASGWMRMSYIYGSNPNWKKIFHKVILEVTGCSASQTVTVKYRKDTDTVATDLAPAIVTNGIVEIDCASPITCNRIQFELHLATSDSSSTPEVSFFRAVGVEIPEVARVHDVIYLIGDEPSKRTKTIRDFLRSGRTSTSLIRFADLRYGETIDDITYHWVVMQPGFPKEVEIYHSKERQPEIGIQCRFQEIDFPVD